MIKQIKSRINRLYLSLPSQINPKKITVKCEHEWYGSAYGGFYVNPQDLDKNSVVYSFGIGEDVSFDQMMIEKHGCYVFGFDPTPKSIRWIKRQSLSPSFRFFDYGIGAKSEWTTFYLPKNPDYVSGSKIHHRHVEKDRMITVPMKSITDITTELGHQHIDVLKMDIEGAEYEVIESILDSQIAVKQLLVEFHDYYLKKGRTKTFHMIALLKKAGFEIFAVSDSLNEVSFINNSTRSPGMAQ